MPDQHKLSDAEVNTLASVFSDEISAGQLLDAAGLSRAHRPRGGATPYAFWVQVNGELDAGVLEDGRRRILQRALQLYPANPVFIQGLRAASLAEPVTGSYNGGPSVGMASGGAGGHGGAGEYRATGDHGTGAGDHGTGAGDHGGGVGHGWDDADTSDVLPETVTVVAIDAVGYSSQIARVHLAMRTGLNRIVQTAFYRAGVPRSAVRLQDTGDGFLITVDGTVSKVVVAAEFVEQLRVALSDYNLEHDGSARLRLRVALHHDDVIHDRTGWAGPGVIVGARLVDSPPIRDAMDGNAQADLVLIVSSAVYDTVIKERYLGTNPDNYRQVDIRMKKFKGEAWLTVPGYGRPAGADAAGARPGGNGTAGRATNAYADAQAAAAVSEWDFFVSVAAADLKWGEWITTDLESQGYTVNLEAWDVQAGRVRPGALDEAIRFSTRTIVVLTPAYLESSDVQTAWAAAWNRDPNGAERRVVPVRIKSCQPTGLLGAIKSIDLVGLPEQEAREHLHEQIRRTIKGSYRPDTPPAFPGDNY